MPGQRPFVTGRRLPGHRAGILAGLLALAFCLAACGGGSASAPATGAVTASLSPHPSPSIAGGPPRPVRITGRQPGFVAAWDGRPEVEPSKGGDTNLQFILANLRRKTLTMAAVGGTLKASCDNDRIVAVPGAVNHCATVYDGLRINWTVDMGNYDPPGSAWLSYSISRPSAALLTATNVYHQFWRQSRALPGLFLEDPRCDVIPAAVLVKFGDTGYRCQSVFKTEVDPGRKRVDWRVMVDDEGRTTIVS